MAWHGLDEIIYRFTFYVDDSTFSLMKICYMKNVVYIIQKADKLGEGGFDVILLLTCNLIKQMRLMI